MAVVTLPGLHRTERERQPEIDKDDNFSIIMTKKEEEFDAEQWNSILQEDFFMLTFGHMLKTEWPYCDIQA